MADAIHIYYTTNAFVLKGIFTKIVFESAYFAAGSAKTNALFAQKQTGAASLKRHGVRFIQHQNGFSNGVRCQILSLYSVIVRSLEKMPLCAVLHTAFFHQRSALW